VTSSPMMSGP